MSYAAPLNTVAIKAALTANLISEMLSGRLQGVAAVGDTWLNELGPVDSFPYVYVDIGSESESLVAIQRKENTLNFNIGLAYKSLISLGDAKANLLTLLDDGAGNGLKAILRDPIFYTLNGLATQTQIRMTTQYYDNLGENPKSSLNQFVSYAIIRYDVTQQFVWQGAK